MPFRLLYLNFVEVWGYGVVIGRSGGRRRFQIVRVHLSGRRGRFHIGLTINFQIQRATPYLFMVVNVSDFPSGLNFRCDLNARSPSCLIGSPRCVLLEDRFLLLGFILFLYEGRSNDLIGLVVLVGGGLYRFLVLVILGEFFKVVFLTLLDVLIESVVTLFLVGNKFLVFFHFNSVFWFK